MRYGGRRTLLRANDCLSFVRAYFEAHVIAILNRSKSPRDLVLDPSPEKTESQLKNLLSNEEIGLKDGRLSVSAPASTALFIGR